MALRYENMKMNFCEQRVEGTLQVWAEPFVCQRMPQADQPAHGPLRAGATITSNTYYDWSIRHAFLVVPTQDVVAQFVATFKEFPPRQRPGSFSVEQVMDMIGQPAQEQPLASR